MARDNSAPAHNDAYTILLSISLMAIIFSCVLLWLDLRRFGSELLPKAPSSPVSPVNISAGANPGGNLPAEVPPAGN